MDNKRWSLEDSLIRSLISNVDGTRSHLRVFSGEATISLYSGPALEEAFWDAFNRGVRIDFIIGPILSVGEGGSSLLLRLTEEGKINLYFRSQRGKGYHYRIIDDHLMYLEYPHDPVEYLSSRFGEQIKDQRRIKEWSERFDTLIETGRGEDFVVCRVSEPRKDLILLTDKEIKLLSRFALRKGKDISLLEKRDIQNLYQEWLDEGKRFQKEAEPDMAIIMNSLKKSLESIKQV